MSNWKVILATLAIFATGVMAGGALVWKLAPRPEASRELPFDPREMRQGYVNHLEHELSLTVDQREKISVVLSNSHERVKLIFEDFNPKMRKEMEQVRDEIKAELQPGQQELFDELRKRRNRYRSRGDRSKEGSSSEGSREGSKYDKRRPNGPPSEGGFPPKDPPAEPKAGSSDQNCRLPCGSSPCLRGSASLG